MNPTQHTFSYHFAAVGQGLFASGFIHKVREPNPQFVWVYDCGTLSCQKLVTNGINRLEAGVGTRRRIDLLTLSHFDEDHISGVCRLVAKFRVRTLMLPYMPLARRLLIAFEEGIGQDDALMGFFVNPVAYLLAQGGPGIDRILFVPASGDEGPPFPEDQPADGPGRFDGDFDDPDIRFEERKPDESDEVIPLAQAAGDQSGGTEVFFLKKGTAITFRSFWEFVPYNDDPEVVIPTAFAAQVNGYKAQILGTTSQVQKQALRDLKRIFDEQFGDSSEQRNVISLPVLRANLWKLELCCASAKTVLPAFVEGLLVCLQPRLQPNLHRRWLP